MCDNLSLDVTEDTVCLHNRPLCLFNDLRTRSVALPPLNLIDCLLMSLKKVYILQQVSFGPLCVFPLLPEFASNTRRERP